MKKNHKQLQSTKEVAKALRNTFSFPEKFSDRNDEQNFKSSHERQFHAYRLATVFVGLMLWLSIVPLEVFGIVYQVRQLNITLWKPLLFTRTLVALVVFIGLTLSLTKLSKTETWSTSLVLVMIASMTTGQLVMVFYIFPYPSNFIFYYNSLAPMVIALFAFTHLLSRPAFLLGMYVLILMAVFVMTYTDSMQAFFATIVPYLPLMIVSHGVAVKFERYERERFMREKELHTLIFKEKHASTVAIQERKKVDEQRELLIQIKESQRRDAEKANAEKSIFLAAAAHDLRQPIHALGNLLESAAGALDKGNLDSTKSLVQLARDAARITRGSFNAVLEISTLESGLVRPNYEEFDVVTVLEEVKSTIQPMADERKVLLSIRARRDYDLVVASDRHLLARVLHNLISNGIKYTDAKKKPNNKVLMGIVCLSNRVRIDVVDNGMGIPKEHWGDIFKPFKQLSNPERDREKGLGLGLSIVNAIIGMLEGHRLDMRSREGRGTRFSVEVPLKALRKKSNESTYISHGVEYDIRGIYIIFVEDDSLVRKSTAALLEEKGILLEAAESFEASERILSGLERDPDVLLTDYKISASVTAIDIMRLVRSRLGYSLPTVILTADVGQVGYPPELSKYVTAVLRKPAEPKELLSALAEAYALSKTLA